jgi:hypothetical protein
MLKYLIAGVLLLPVAALSEPVTVDKEVLCDNVKTMVEVLADKYGEQPIVIAQGKKSRIAVVVNPKTTTWTVIEYNETVSCVLGEGEGFNIRPDVLGKRISM